MTIIFLHHVSVYANVENDSSISLEKIYEFDSNQAINLDLLDIQNNSSNILNFRLDARPLMKDNYPQALKIKAYVIDNTNQEELISIISSTIIRRKHARNYQFEIELPESFSSQDLYIDIFDSDLNLSASFKHFIERNSSQVTQKLSSANCSNTEFGDCHLQYILNSINYQASVSQKPNVMVNQEVSGQYTVTLPLIKSKGMRIINKDFSNNSDIDTTNENSEALNSQEVVNLISQGEIEFEQIHLKSKTQEEMSSTLPVDGTLEFDGNKLYLVRNGQRQEIGKEGPSGPTGAQGPPGVPGSPGYFSGGDADINGRLTFLSQGKLVNANIEGVMKLEQTTSPPTKAEPGDIYHDSSSAICVFIGNQWQKLIGNGNCKPGLTVPKNLSYPSTNDLNIYYDISIAPNFNGDLNSVFSISPNLPTGLSLNPSTGVIYGTPTVLSPLQSYTVTVSNALGSLSDTFDLGIYDESLDFANMTISGDTLPDHSGAGSIEVVGSQIFLIGGHDSWWGLGRHTNVQYADLATPTSFSEYGQGTLNADIAWSDTIQVGDYVYTLGSVQSTRDHVLRAHNSDLSTWSDYATLPGSSFLNWAFKDDDSVFLLGSGENGDLIYRAPINDLTNWEVLGPITGLTRSNHFFQINNNYFAVSASNIYRANNYDLTTWTDISASAPPAEANAGLSALIGSHAYIIGNFSSTNIYSASITDIGSWVTLAETLPYSVWGMHHGLRVGNNFYIYGGMNNSYTGQTSIIVIPILKTYS